MVAGTACSLAANDLYPELANIFTASMIFSLDNLTGKEQVKGNPY
jgi:hypothetical protein